MSAPIANFGFSRNILVVDFINLSLNIEVSTTYLWDFGDGQTSTLKDPSVTYTAAGFFNVILTTTTGTDISTINMTVGVGSLVSVLNTPILQLTQYYLPSTILAKTDKLVTLIQTWQVYLQPLVEYPLVDAQDTHNEYQWGVLANKLIAMLVAKDMITTELTSFLANAASEGSNSTSTGDESNTSTRSIKSIETGPVKTEWYEGNTSNQNSEVIKNVGASFSNAGGDGGIIDQLDKSICTLSKRIRVYLPECGTLVNPTMGMLIGETPLVGSLLNTKPSWYQDPWETCIIF